MKHEAHAPSGGRHQHPPEQGGSSHAPDHGHERVEHVPGPRPGSPAGHDHGTGRDRHAGHSVAMFRDRFWLSLALTVPTVVWGHMLPSATGFMAPMFPGSEWIAPAFGTVVFFYGGLVFIRGALSELRARLPGMMTLIS